MRIEQLTFPRFVAAISIFVYHYGKNIFPFNLEYSGFLFKQANVGVSFFFILSGFVMIIAYHNYKKIGFLEFVKRRFARIYPVYLLAIVLYFIYLLARRMPLDYTGLILNLTMIQSWFPGYALSFNTPGWSLAVEFFFYATFPFLFNYLYKNSTLKKLTIPIILIFVISQVVHHWLMVSPFNSGYPSKSYDFIFYFPLMHWSEFLIGNLAGLFFIQHRINRNFDWHIISLVLLYAIILRFDTIISYHNGMMAFIFVPLILLIAYNNGLITRTMTLSIPVFLGEISYSIYILQKPIYRWIKAIMLYFDMDNPTMIFYTALIVLIAASALSYHFLETPIRDRINHWNHQKRKKTNRPMAYTEEKVEYIN